MKLIELLGKNNVKGDYALELEVEGTSLPDVFNAYWETTIDGSLRGEAKEYVSKGPKSIKQLDNALKNLNDRFQDSDSVINQSYRTSTHVHQNVLHLEMEELFTLIYLYYLYEELLVTFSGENRKGNRFCLRLRDAEGVIENILNTFKQNSKFLKRVSHRKVDAEIWGNSCRYSALNLASIAKFGSLEYRSLRGTTDRETITLWVKLLDCLKNAAIFFKTPLSVKDCLDNNGVADLSLKVFGDLFRHIEFNGWENDVAYNASLAIQLPYELSYSSEEEVKKMWGNNPLVMPDEMPIDAFNRLAEEQW